MEDVIARPVRLINKHVILADIFGTKKQIFLKVRRGNSPQNLFDELRGHIVHFEIDNRRFICMAKII